VLSLYNTALLPLRPIAAVWARVGGRGAERRREWAERRALRLPEAGPDGIWVHGSSLGEAQIARLLVRRLRAERPRLSVVVSAYTPTGRAQLPSPPEVDASFYMPLDFRGYPGRLLDALRPALLGLVETELWPNLVHEASTRNVGVVVLNARLAPERMNRYRRFSALYGPVLRRLAGVGAQSDDDAARFESLGVVPAAIEVTGNVKYDLPLPEGNTEELRRRYGLSEQRPVFVAGSTGAGEEPPVLDAFQHARGEHPSLYLVLAPRHPQRTSEVESELRSRRLAFTRLSSGPEALSASDDVLLVDTVGELARLYRLATVAFVGGSLVPVGGHNLLEPVAVSAPVLFGPYTHHVAEMAETLERESAGLRVRDGSELGRQLVRLLSNAELRGDIVAAADAVLTRNRGALDRTVSFLFAALERSLRSRSSPGVA
jgi:3-deoxy-D-manno-octulosonic-acid transferase